MGTQTSEDDNLLSPFLNRDTVDTFVKLNWLLIKIICTFLGVVAFCITSQIVDFDVKKVVRQLHRKTPDEAELEVKSIELNKLKGELSTMSEMDEFAKYHRKRRVILKLQDEFDALSLKTKKLNMFESVKMVLVCRFIIAFMGFVFSYFTRDVIVTSIPGGMVRPFGFILTLPWIFQAYDAQGHIPVTLFNLLLLISIVNAAYQNQSKKRAEMLKQQSGKKTN